MKNRKVLNEVLQPSTVDSGKIVNTQNTDGWYVGNCQSLTWQINPYFGGVGDAFPQEGDTVYICK